MLWIYTSTCNAWRRRSWNLRMARSRKAGWSLDNSLNAMCARGGAGATLGGTSQVRSCRAPSARVWTRAGRKIATSWTCSSATRTSLKRWSSTPSTSPSSPRASTTARVKTRRSATRPSVSRSCRRRPSRQRRRLPCRRRLLCCLALARSTSWRRLLRATARTRASRPLWPRRSCHATPATACTR